MLVYVCVYVRAHHGCENLSHIEASKFGYGMTKTSPNESVSQIFDFFVLYLTEKFAYFQV